MDYKTIKPASYDKKYHPKEKEEALFQIIGSYGPWQRDIFIIFFLLNVIGMSQSLAITFLAPDIEYWCASNLVDANFSDRTSSYNSSHVLYQKANQCEITVHLQSNSNSTDSETKRIPCERWEYNTSFYSQTIINEWDLVCEREWLVSLAKSSYMVGFMASVFVFGQFADCFGRFPTVLICWAITCVSGILSAFSTSYLMFVVLRFLTAFGRAGFSTTGYVIIMETVGPKWRTDLGLAIQLGWSIGFSTLPAVAWFIRHWVHLQLALSVPILGFVCIYWVVPESPRWLMTQRKRKQFEELIEKAVRKNSREITDDIKNILTFSTIKTTEDEPRKMTLLDLVRTPQMRKRTITMACLWLVNGFIYYSLSFNTNGLVGDPYLNCFRCGLIEFPSYALVWLTIKKWGRKFPTVIGLVICGAACAAMILVPEDVYWLNIVVPLISKLCIAATFGTLYLYAMEMFPTVVRTLSIGTFSTFARVGSIIAPFIRELGKATNSWVPNALIAILSLASAMLVLLLPETKGRKIPDTLQEGEEFGCDAPAEERNGSLMLNNFYH